MYEEETRFEDSSPIIFIFFVLKWEIEEVGEMKG